MSCLAPPAPLARRSTGSSRARRRRNSLRARSLALGCAALFGCSHNVLVSLPSNEAVWIDAFASKATKNYVTIEARTRTTTGEPLVDIGHVATPVLIQVRNDGKTPLSLSPDAFELVSAIAIFHPLPAAQIPRRYDDRQVSELAATTLPPGTSVTGLLFFQPMDGDWGFIRLRATVPGGTEGAPSRTIDIPFSSGESVRCTLETLDQDSSTRGNDGTGNESSFVTCPR